MKGELKIKDGKLWFCFRRYEIADYLSFCEENRWLLSSQHDNFTAHLTVYIFSQTNGPVRPV